MIPEAVQRLAYPWQLAVKVDNKYAIQTFPPLLTMLRTIVATGMERSGGSSDPSQRLPVATNALDLLTHIEDTVTAWLTEWGWTPHPDLRNRVVVFYAKAEAIGSELAEYPARWATQIWDLFEPPYTVRLRNLPCPVCGVATIYSEDGSSANLTVTKRAGLLSARCRNPSCGREWQDIDGLKSLGRQAGLAFDAEAL